MDAEIFLLSIVGIALACFTIIVIAVLWYSYKEEKLKKMKPPQIARPAITRAAPTCQ